MRRLLIIALCVALGFWSRSSYALEVIPEVYAPHTDETKKSDDSDDKKTEKTPQKDPYSNLPNQAVIDPFKDAAESVWSRRRFDTKTFSTSTFPGAKDIPIKENSEFTKTLNFSNSKLGEQKWGGGMDKKSPFASEVSEFSGREAKSFDTQSSWQSRSFPIKTLTLQSETSSFNSQPMAPDSGKMYEGPLTGKGMKPLDNRPLSEFFAGKLKNKDGQILNLDEVKKLLNETSPSLQ